MCRVIDCVLCCGPGFGFLISRCQSIFWQRYMCYVLHVFPFKKNYNCKLNMMRVPGPDSYCLPFHPACRKDFLRLLATESIFSFLAQAANRPFSAMCSTTRGMAINPSVNQLCYWLCCLCEELASAANAFIGVFVALKKVVGAGSPAVGVVFLPALIFYFHAEWQVDGCSLPCSLP